MPDTLFSSILIINRQSSTPLLFVVFYWDRWRHDQSFVHLNSVIFILLVIQSIYSIYCCLSKPRSPFHLTSYFATPRVIRPSSFIRRSDLSALTLCVEQNFISLTDLGRVICLPVLLETTNYEMHHVFSRRCDPCWRNWRWSELMNHGFDYMRSAIILHFYPIQDHGSALQPKCGRSLHHGVNYVYLDHCSRNSDSNFSRTYR